MTATFDGLTPVILAKLQGLSELSVSYDYHTEKVSGYPAATFEPSSNSNEYYTNSENLREYSFDIIIQQEMTVAKRRNAIANLRKAVDAVIAAFDSDTTLRVTGSCHYVKALPSSWGEFPGQKGPIRFARLVLVCGVEVAV